MKKTLDKIVKDNHIVLTPNATDRVYYYIFQDFIGYGKIDILITNYELRITN